MSGPSGEVAYPEFVADAYTNFMDSDISSGTGSITTVIPTNVIDSVNTMVGSSPYASLTAFDPDTLLTDYDNRIDTFIERVEEIDAEGMWESYANSAIGLVDEMLIEPLEEDEDAEVRNFEEQSLHNLAESYNRMNASLMDINAVVGTVMPTGHAILEAKFNSDVAKFKSDRRTQIRGDKTNRNRERAVLITQAISEMARIHSLRMNSEGNAVNVKDRFTSIKNEMKNSETRLSLDLAVHDDTWDLDTLTRGGAMINAMQGIVPVPDKMTPTQALLSNATAAAGFGLTVGVQTGSPELGLATFIGGTLLGQAAFNS